MKILQIATVGENVDAVLMGVREFPVARIHLLYTKDFAPQAKSLANRFDSIKLDTKVHEVEGDPLIFCLRTVTEVVTKEKAQFDEVLINVAGGPRMMTCALLSAAFVNGIQSFDCMNNAPVPLPVLKFSYTELVSDAKLNVLRALESKGGSVASLSDLGSVAGEEASLLSYHIRGGRDSRGLEDLGLVKVERGSQGKLTISLTPLGRLMLTGRG